MSVLLITIGRLNTDGLPALERYAAGVIPLIAAAGAELVTRGSPQETVVGSADNQPDLVAIMRFPTADAVRAFLDSAAYRAQIVHRSQAFADVRSYIARDLTETAVG